MLKRQACAKFQSQIFDEREVIQIIKVVRWHFCQVYKCCEPLQKMKMGLGACKTGLSPLLIVPKSILLLWFKLFCFGVDFLCCLSLMYVFIFLVQFGYLSGRLLGNSCIIRLTICFLGISI